MALVEGTHGPILLGTPRQMVIAATCLVAGRVSRINGTLCRVRGSPTKVTGRKKLSRPTVNSGRSTKRAWAWRCTKGNRESRMLSLPLSCHAGHILSTGVGMVVGANIPIPALRLYPMMNTTSSSVWRARWPTSVTSIACGVCLNQTDSPLSMNIKWTKLRTFNYVVKEELVGRVMVPP